MSATPGPHRRQLHLGYMYWVNGTHWGGWRQPDAPTDGAFDVAYALRAAHTVERAKFDFFFLGDTLPGDIVDEQWKTTHNTGRLEPFTLGSQLALQTTDIGIVVTAHPTFYDPYILARLTSSLDHLSGGRLAWNVVLGASDAAARNFGLDDLGGASRYERADEFIEVVKRLWDSIEDDAYIQDKESGRFIDDSRIHRLNWRGEHFRVEGTLPLRRPPQGHPPLLYAGASEASRALSAKWADVHFTNSRTIEASAAFNADVRERAAAFGRDPEQLFFLPGITPVIGDTRASAVAVYDRLNAALPLDDDIVWGGRDREHWAAYAASPAGQAPLGHGLRNLGALSALIGVDVTDAGLDAVFPSAHVAGLSERGRRLLASVTERTDRTPEGADPVRVRDLLYASVIDGFPLAIGTAESVADTLQEWFEQGAADGFNVQSPYLWGQLDRFADEVVPILQRRGLQRTEYEASTFRGHLGLPRPRGFFDGR
ncbi:NtaA/DmoA family FMN-dependent monooxygenase [Microbacterium betulae]|uniref:NtaA/DmoA family FMN-dependent monooxygenase n=1 Tax=Microbacterium betulae TaxID=2981139 RepID=A0AA97FIS1_9MICO|nr:NtaA/DmoA family FMN-dependent monooxygenase [Microbacterium sp. AB]WOF23478.1 NtaA/DmoA family FMN-dependent monooxygenase [Microbacterium sp. AB]